MHGFPPNEVPLTVSLTSTWRCQNDQQCPLAAGNNLATGGIDEYAYVYRIYLKNNPYKITFANHNRYNGGQRGRMHSQDFIVDALKGESGIYVRYALACEVCPGVDTDRLLPHRLRF